MIDNLTDKEKRYQEIVNAYQIARRDPKKQKEAAKLLAITDKMEASGEISEDAIMGMKYF